MKALIYTTPNAVVYTDIPQPELEPGEVLVKVDAVGVCGSDMHAYHGHDQRRPPPLVLGHEATGTIASGPHSGARVAINPLVTCGVCNFCKSHLTHLCAIRQIISMPPRPGAFAEYTKIPEGNLVAVPEGFSIVKAALAEPVAVSYHAAKVGIRLLQRPLDGVRCVVLGGGAIGLAAALVMRMFGAEEISVGETNGLRQQTIRQAGDFLVFTPGTEDEPAAASAELVVDAVGADATRSFACKCVKPGGVIVHVGLLPGDGGIDVRRLTLQEITFAGSYCYTATDFQEAFAAMVSGRLGALDWFEERPLSEGARAFEDLDASRAATAKIILRP